MENKMEVIRFGINYELYAIAEQSPEKAVTKPYIVRIFEVQGDPHPAKDLCIVGDSSIKKLRDFLAGLYDPEDHPNGCTCPTCTKYTAAVQLLGRVLPLFDGLELNRDRDLPSMVHLGPEGLLHNDIARLRSAIEEMLEPHE